MFKETIYQFRFLAVLLLQSPCFAEQYNEVSFRDIRVVRDDTLESNGSLNSLLTENPFLGRNDEDDFTWLDDTIKDIAYYLRSHKFNEYDRRYETNAANAPKEYYSMFPRPPLKALHWEVQQFCEPSFLSCMKYVKRRLKDTGLKRQDDTSIVIMEQKWTKAKNLEQIEEIDNECRKMRDKDNIVADPFQGPIERFQWRTTASYYLCWYTMNEVPDLKHIKESCDNFAYCLDNKYGEKNFAYCLDNKYGEKNHDYRAKDNVPFACATYSFCPDPCCSAFKHTIEPIICHNNARNPCYETNPEGKRRCGFVRSENRNFHDIILNRWNVTCNCSDVDECGGNAHSCDNNTEICVNLPGSYECACRWGYAWNVDENKCTEHNALAVIKKERKEEDEERNRTVAKSLVKMLYAKLVALKSGYPGCRKFAYNSLIVLEIVFANLS
ncbi:Calcium-binding EGF domain [Popillia japonica]|uniref:Calcium-binding EGF domain n=1 Tax=Popillia japonica TaxID=7064 RepID=A0AAW1KHW5_POPJA